MKKLICVLSAFALLFSLTACGGKNSPVKPIEPATTVKDEYIAAEVGENLQKTEIAKTDKQSYYLTTVESKRVFCRTDLQGRLKILLTFGDGEPKFFPETFVRSGQKMIYYTYLNKGDETASLYAFNFLTDRAVKVIGSPCSDFILLDLPDTYEMYPYGFIADVNGVKVIDLVSGGASSHYSTTIGQMKIFFVDPDSYPAVFFSKNLSTTIADMGDRSHIRIDTVERKSNGEVKRQWSVSFSPALSVAQEIKDE